MKKLILFLRSKKKGNALLEFLVVLPNLILLIFIGVHFFLYMFAGSRAETAAEDIARVVAMEMRGTPVGTSPASLNGMTNKIYTAATITMASNESLIIDRNDINYYATSNCPFTPGINVCVSQIGAGATAQEQVIVVVSGKYKGMKSFQDLGLKMAVNGRGTTIKDGAGRFQYN